MFVYIHGFASSPGSRKAERFREAFAARHISLQIPPMDQGDFEHLTISGQLRVLENTIRGESAVLIGSSLGGYLASLYAAAHPEVARLVLLAPAFGFAERWSQRIGEPRPAYLDVFHYGENCVRRVHYGLIADALRYPAAPDFTQAACIFHGVNDDVVPIEYSRSFAAVHPNVRLTELDSDHDLLNVLDSVIDDAIPFLLGQGTARLTAMSTIPNGTSAPDFELPDQHGKAVRLSDYRGKSPTVVYFYPKDETPGCTAEACKFRDDFEKFSDAGAVVFGISDDSPESHLSFASNHRLPFQLLSDTDGTVRKLYGVKKTLGVIPGRVTFVIDRDGIVRHTFSSQSDPERHVDEALAALAASRG
jgi:peroxiredoxin